MQPFSTVLLGRVGNGILTTQLMKMVAGAINPGKPVANLYVSSCPMLTVNSPLASSINVDMAVLDVESRRYSDVRFPRS